MFGITSSTAKLQVGMTLDSIQDNQNISQKVKRQQIELFNKYDTNPADGRIDEQEFANYQKGLRKNRIKNTLLIAGCTILATAVTYLAVKGGKSNKLTDYEKLLQKAEKEGSAIEQVEGGVNITSEFIWKNGELHRIACGTAEAQLTEVAFHETGNKVPSMITRYAKRNPVAQRMIREGGTIKHYILDRTSGYGVEYLGYNQLGDAISDSKQVVNIINSEGTVLKTYVGEEIENALLVKEWASHDSYSKRLLDVREAVGDYWTDNIVGWQATDGTREMVNAGKRFIPETAIRPYTDFVPKADVFSSRLTELNDYARSRNLIIEEITEGGAPKLIFKNDAGQILRTVTADGTSTFNKFNGDGKLIESAVRDAGGKISSRSVNEYRAFWNRCTGSATIDYTKNQITHTDIHGKSKTEALNCPNGRYFFTELLER